MAGADIIQRREIAEEEAAERFSLLLSGEASAEDRLEIDAWRLSHPANDDAWSRIAGIWHGSIEAAHIPAIMTMRQTALAANRPSWARRHWRPLALAASLAVALVSTPWLASNLSGPATTIGNGDNVAWSQPTRTRVGQIETVKLADGSIMTVNTDSAVRTALSPSARRIRLDRGEARFDVAKNPAAPFTVVAGDISVTAVGTSFSVRETGGEVFVTLAEGRVRVDRRQAGDSVVLEPGSQLRAGKEGFRVAHIDPRRAMSWSSGALDFDQVPLGTVVRELNRYATQQIVVGDRMLAAQPVTGVFPVGDQQRVVDMLVANGQVQIIRRTDNAIELDRR